MGWDVVQNWMLTGHFEWRVPLRGVVHTWQHKGGKPPMDWWGIQYYSRCAFLSLNWAGAEYGTFSTDITPDVGIA